MKMLHAVFTAIFLCMSQFSVLNADWAMPPVNISPVPAGLLPTVGVDANGNAVAAWIGGGPGNTQILASRLPFNGTWTLTSPVASTTSGFNNPQIGVFPNGDALLTWNGDTTNQVFAAFLPFGGSTWTTPVTISGGGAADLQSISVNALNNAVSVWREFVGFDSLLRGAAFHLGTWSPSVTISMLPLQVFNFQPTQVILNNADNSLAAWITFNGTNRFVQAATAAGFPTGGTWNTPVSVSAVVAGSDADFVGAAMNDAGNAILVWREAIGANLVIQSSSSQFPSATWSSPITIPGTPPNILDDTIQVQIDAAGNAVAAWAATDSTTSFVQASTLPFGSTSWSTPINIAEIALPLAFFQLRLVENASDQLIAMWFLTNINTLAIANIQAATSVGGTVWSTPLPVSPTNEFAFFHDVAIDPNGNAVAVWQQNPMGNDFVQATIGRDLFVPPVPPFPTPPSNIVGRVIKNEFLTQTDCIHQLTWTPSFDPTVAGYNIYRNDKLLAIIPATGPFFFRDHKRCKHADVYKITAFNASGGESTAITVKLKS